MKCLDGGNKESRVDETEHETMIIGIDLGTTFSLVGYVNRAGTPVLCPHLDNSENFQTASVVHVGERGCLVGDLVEQLLDEEAGLAICRFAKLSMGTDKTVFTDHQGRDYSAEAISSLVLRKLKADAESACQEAVTGAVITVPAHFNEAERRATVNAGRLADLPVLGVVEEPVAAATYFGLDAKHGEKTIFVFDIGGGTLDATVLQATPDGLYVLATEGAKNIGGKNFDEVIMGIVEDQYRSQHRVGISDDNEAMQKLRTFATRAKIELSEPGRGVISKPLILAGRQIRVTFNRAQFEEAAEPWLEASELICEKALKAAGMGWDDIDDLVLTGGSSLLPCVERKVREMSGLPKTRVRRQQPHASVAYGAAILAEQMHGDKQVAAPPLRQLVTGNELGVRVFDPQAKKAVFHALIEKNVPVPATARETLYTRSKEQKTVSIEVLQRKDEYEVAENLGKFTFGPIAEPEKNYPVEVELGYDAAGRVTIKAKDGRAGAVIEQVFDGDEEVALSDEYYRLQELVVKS